MADLALSSFSEKMKARFWAKVQKRGENECWHWTGSKLPKGYGKVRVGSTVEYAHRVALLFDGRNPSRRVARHRCDNPQCVNPAHLELGSIADNSADMTKRGRSMTGERNPAAKLTPFAVTAIRQAKGTHCSVAGQFSVSEATIRDVRAGRTWIGKTTVAVQLNAEV